MKNLKEEIGRSHHTVDNDPYQYDDNENVNVEMYANDEGTWSVKVTCVSDPSLSYPLQRFPDEASAEHHARQCCDRIIRHTMNEEKLRLLIRNILIEGFAEDLATVSTGREAKRVFAKYVNQDDFKDGRIVHWTGTTRNLKKILSNPNPKDELSCNYYGDDSSRDWMALGPKKAIGIVVDGWVTYAGMQNMFTGYGKRPRGKKEKAAWDHRKASSGINKHPYGMWENEEDYLEMLRNAEIAKPKGSIEPFGKDKRSREMLGDDAWMWGMSKSDQEELAKYPEYADWNEVLVDNWKPIGIAYGGVGRYGLSERNVKSLRKIAEEYGLPLIKIGSMA